jgi:LysM repeat protein
VVVPGVTEETPAATATPPPPATVTIGPAGLVYVVQPGDTLTALSERFGLSPEAIAAANGMAEPQPLLAEQELVIPGAVYHVQPGDTLADIAAAFGVPQAVIVTANSIAAPGAIGAGQPLAIPGGGALPATQAPSPTAEQPRPTPTAAAAPMVPSEPEQQPPSEADEQALADAERDTLAADEGGPSAETVVRWLEIGLATGMALLFVSWVLARRRGRA